MTYAEMMMIKSSTKMTKTVTCPFCGRVSEISATPEPVQSIFPELSASKRELLITQMCYECQNETFGVDA